MRPRVLLAGIFHETHTFLPGATTLADFAIRPAQHILAAEGDGSPLAGAIETGRECDWELAPTVDLRATPSATVEDDVVEFFWGVFSDAVKRETPRGIRGALLVLHGAMVSRSFADVEGELLRRMRALPELAPLPIVGVIDLHANFTLDMARYADALVAYRENPHTDAHRAACHAARLLNRLMRSGERPTTVLVQPPLVWPPTATATAADPMHTLEAMARKLEDADADLLAVNVMAGFAFADIPETGPAFTAITVGNPARALAQLEELSAWAVAHRELGQATEPTLEEIMPRLRDHAEGPVLLVEPSDNIGGGAPGDGVAILRAMVEHDLPSAAVIINDPQSAATCHAAARGVDVYQGPLPMPVTLRLSIGGRENSWAGGPVELDVELVSISDGQFELEDRHSHLASMSGTHIEMGKCAVVRRRGVTILLTSRKTPPFDLGQWTSQGLDPRGFGVIGVKAAVAHRQGYDPITRASYTVDTPGPCSSNLAKFPFRHIRRPVYPLDPLPTSFPQGSGNKSENV